MRAVLMLGMMVLLYACSPVSPSRLTKTFRSTEEQFQDHTGFVLYDPATKKTLYDFNGSSYFTPASNTKILTFYTALNVLADSVPALEFVQRGDSLIFWGTGDPSFLNKEVFYDSAAYQFLSNAEGDLYFSRANYDANHFGDGWAWDDYNSSYSPERSAFPLYGNVVSVIADHEVLRITPQWFAPFFSSGKPQKKTRVVRDLHRNRFVVHHSNQPVEVDEFNIPFQADSLTWISLLADTLKRPVYYAANKKPAFTHTLFSIHVDSLYSVMMQDSDNFIAEQLLLMSANVLSDTLKPEIAINYSLKHFLKDLPDKPMWVDGSGLSRYNLITPRTVVRLWEKISELVPRDRLFPLLATGGITGTIKNWYAAGTPYIFGKTGTLSNNHCLSGYLVAKSGRVLIFSFMNSNYTTPSNAIRRNMQKVLQNIYEHY